MAHGIFTQRALTRRPLARPTLHVGVRARRALGAALTAALGLTAVSLVAPFAPAAQAAENVVQVGYTGAPQNVVVPAGAVSVSVVAQGGSGGASPFAVGTAGGSGMYIEAQFPVTAGETLVAVVGGNGGEGDGGYNGGAAGRNPAATSTSVGGGGGGATDLRRGGAGLEHRILVAAGGGGTGVHAGSAGGSARSVAGGAGRSAADCDGGIGGRGGTSSAGGSQAAGCGTPEGTSGALGAGGIPGYRNLSDGNNMGGGGGGGLFGGGGGNAFSGGGAGSSYLASLPGSSSTMREGVPGATPHLTLTFEIRQAINGSISISPANVVANGADSFQATAMLTDADGRPVAGDTVTFESDDPGQTVGATANLGNGVYTAMITSSSQVGAFKVTARAASNPRLTLATSGMQIAANAAERVTFDQGQYVVVAGNELAAPVSLTTRDAAGNPVDATGLVVASSDPAQTVSEPRRTGPGRYTVTVSPGTVAGDSTLTASVGSVPLGRTALRVRPADAERMELDLEKSTLVADEVSATNLRIRFFDRFDNHTTAEISSVSNSGAQVASSFPLKQTDGSFVMPVRAQQQHGIATITILPKNLASQQVQLTLTQAPATSIEVRLADTELVADGKKKTRLSAVVRNQFGQPVSGHEVAVESSDPDVAVGETADNGDGTYSAEVTASTSAGYVTLTATDTSVDPALSGQVTLTQVAGPIANLTPALSASRIVADGKSTTRLTMTLTDAHGNAIDGRLLRVTSSDPGMTTGLLIGQGNGIYALDVRSSTAAGWATLTVTEGADPGRLLSMLVLEQVAGPVAEVTATLDTSTLVADGASRTQLRIRAADEHGNGVAGVAFAADSGASGVQTGRLDDHRDGNYTLEVTSSTVAGDAVITVSDDSGNPAATKEVMLRQVAGPAHALAAELAAPSLPADGASTTELRARLVDNHGNAVSGGKLSVESSDPGVRVGPFTDHGDGRYTAEVTASTVAGAVTLTVTDASVSPALVQPVTLQQRAGAPAAAELALGENSLVADGKSETTLRAAVVDAHGNPVSGAPIGAVSTDAGQLIGDATESAPGVYEITLRSSTTPGTSTISVGTVQPPAAGLAAAGGAAFSLEPVGRAATPGENELDLVLATIELRQTPVEVTPEPKPEPKPKPEPGVTPTPEPGAPAVKPDVSPKLAASGVGSVAAPAGAALALLIAGGVALLLRRGRRDA